MLGEDLLGPAAEAMDAADVAFVTTIGEDGYPHTRAMFNLRNPRWFPRQAALFAAHRRDLLVLLTTNTSSSKVRHLRRDPRMGVYFCDPVRYLGLQLTGDGEVLDDPSIRRALWNEGWERYYPGGPDDPEHTILRLRPRRAEGWRESRRFEFELPVPPAHLAPDGSGAPCEMHGGPPRDARRARPPGLAPPS